jgi:broad specificity phosphatase PhoE
MKYLLILFLVIPIVRSSNADNAKEKTITFVYLRHGQSTWNATPKAQQAASKFRGVLKKILPVEAVLDQKNPFVHCDSPLTEEGKSQCEGWSLDMVKERLKYGNSDNLPLPTPTKFFSSPLSRAFQSLTSAFGNDITKEDDISDVNILTFSKVESLSSYNKIR